MGSRRSLHLSVQIDRPASAVYAYAGDPRHLPAWAAGLAAGIEQVDRRWVATSPMGAVTVSFVAPNDLGVLDHDVTLPSGEVVHNPLRVLPDGEGCEVVFTLRQGPEVADEDFDEDAVAVRADLATLKRVLETGSTGAR